MPEWNIDALAELCLAVQRIPAPTFAEAERAAFVAGRWIALGLPEVEVDAAPNVYARVPGRQAGPGLLVSAHLDTVFPEGTDLASRREGDRLLGPGIGDNSMGVTGLLALAEGLAAAPPPPRDIWLLANAAEEGLGDLAGMRAALDRLGDQVGACIVIEGSRPEAWPITHRALGSRRYRIRARAAGGHSWGNFGRSSAIHLLVALADRITRWELPPGPRSSFNIGVIEGGTSVNSIAERASLLLDLRSEDPVVLATLADRTEALVAEFAALAAAAGDAGVEADRVGDRPAGEIPREHPLVAAAAAVLDELGVAPEAISYRVSSTDANLPLSRGLPALTIHLTRGGNAHRLDEWLSLADLPLGLEQLWRLTGRAVEWVAGGGGTPLGAAAQE